MENKSLRETLTILQEECAEVIVEASKILRFSNDGERLEREVGDLICMIELLYEQRIMDPGNVAVQAREKREKLKKWSNIENL